MNKYILTFAFLILGLLNVHAFTLNQTELKENLERTTPEIQGTYTGKATPSMMNGKETTSGKSYDCTYTIDANGFISGSFRVGPHDISMQSTASVTTSAQGVPVEGNIKLLVVNFNFRGNIFVTSLDGTNLEFSCDVTTNKGQRSKFSFKGRK